jgi:hypothetical protein
MTALDWRWKIGEAIERLRTRYGSIGRKTGAPFLALVYPTQAEATFLREWHTQTAALRPEIDVRSVNVLDVTQTILSEIGAEAIVDALTDPMPGSNPQGELGLLWVNGIADAIRTCLADPATGKTVVSLERLAAVHPAAGPRDVMQFLWDSASDTFDGPIVILIPGTLRGSRTYTFLDQRDEFMYRGDLL